MWIRKLVVLSFLSLCAPASGDVIYDSQGFEGFSVGMLDGQDGWIADWFAPGPYIGHSPEIQDFGAAFGGLGIVLQGNEVSAAFIEREFPDILGSGYQQVTVSFDIWRFSSDVPMNGMDWFWYEGFWTEFEPAHGVQRHMENGESTVYPFGEQSPLGDLYPMAETIYDRWTNLTMTWDFSVATASAWYDGVFVGSVPISDPSSLTGWYMSLGGGPSHACIDNFIITAVVPEPSPLLLLAAGVLVQSRRRRGRR